MFNMYAINVQDMLEYIQIFLSWCKFN